MNMPSKYSKIEILVDYGCKPLLSRKNSRGERVSTYDGPILTIDRTPVWTAFITHQVASRTWIRKADSRTIHLTELQRYIFTTDYSPQLGPGGEHELSFDESDGSWQGIEWCQDWANWVLAARGFIRAIDELRRH